MEPGRSGRAENARIILNRAASINKKLEIAAAPFFVASPAVATILAVMGSLPRDATPRQEAKRPSPPAESASGKAAPRVYIFHGNDAQALDEAVQRVVDAWRDSAGPPIRFDGGAEPAAVYEELYTPFIGGGQKLIVLRDSGGGGGRGGGAPRGSESPGDESPAGTPSAGGSWAVRHKKFLDDLFKAPSPDAVFILVTPRWPIAGVTPPDGAAIRGFDAPREFERDRQAPGLVAGLFASHRKRVAADAIRALIDRLGTDRGLLADAAETLALHAGAREEVTRDDVETMIQGVRPGNTFHMTRACVMGEQARALDELRRLYAHAGRPEEFGPRLLGAIAWQYREVARTCEALAAGATRVDALKRWCVHRGPDQDRLLRRLRSLAGRSLAAGREWILETDMTLKTGRLHPRVAIETLVFRLSSLP
jgi:DNA polymerase III delta subunit